MLLKLNSQMDKIKNMCWKCGKNIELKNIAFKDECSFCHTDLHSCKNCIFYLPGAHYDCHESVEEFVSDKESSNFCDYFKVKNDFSDLKNDSVQNKSAAAKKAFDALFS